MREHGFLPVELPDDVRHGTIQIPKAPAEEDFIIKRRDGLFAYNLVGTDDIKQVTEVVRGWSHRTYRPPTGGL